MQGWTLFMLVCGRWHQFQGVASEVLAIRTPCISFKCSGLQRRHTPCGWGLCFDVGSGGQDWVDVFFWPTAACHVSWGRGLRWSERGSIIKGRGCLPPSWRTSSVHLQPMHACMHAPTLECSLHENSLTQCAHFLQSSDVVFVRFTKFLPVVRCGLCEVYLISTIFQMWFVWVILNFHQSPAVVCVRFIKVMQFSPYHEICRQTFLPAQSVLYFIFIHAERCCVYMFLIQLL